VAITAHVIRASPTGGSLLRSCYPVPAGPGNRPPPNSNDRDVHSPVFPFVCEPQSTSPQRLRSRHVVSASTDRCRGCPARTSRHGSNEYDRACGALVLDIHVIVSSVDSNKRYVDTTAGDERMGRVIRFGHAVLPRSPRHFGTARHRPGEGGGSSRVPLGRDAPELRLRGVRRRLVASQKHRQRPSHFRHLPRVTIRSGYGGAEVPLTCHPHPLPHLKPEESDALRTVGLCR
jgi:hypothetical protein